MKNITLLNREMLQRIHMDNDLQNILTTIANVGKEIDNMIKNNDLAEEKNIEKNNIASYNASGDRQVELDIIANKLFISALKGNKSVCAIASEEENNVIENDIKGKYIVNLDPLDGSSNVHYNMPIGSIFSVYRRISPCSEKINIAKDVLQKGKNQLLAGYLLYSLQTVLIFGYQDTVYNFMLTPGLEGKKFFYQRNIIMNKSKSIYSINANNYYSIMPKLKSQLFLTKCRELELNIRYSGTLVADFHRILLQGGIFLYPALENRYPDGKLRLLFECNPIAFIAKCAGGKAIDIKIKDILEKKPKKLHERSPFIVGNEKLMDLYIKTE